MRSDLKAIDGISKIETDLDELTCCFEITGDVNVEELLNKLAESNNKIKDWTHLN